MHFETERLTLSLIPYVQYIYFTRLSRFQKLLNKFGLEIGQHYKKKKVNLECRCLTHDPKLNK